MVVGGVAPVFKWKHSCRVITDCFAISKQETGWFTHHTARFRCNSKLFFDEEYGNVNKKEKKVRLCHHRVFIYSRQELHRSRCLMHTQNRNNRIRQAKGWRETDDSKMAGRIKTMNVKKRIRIQNDHAAMIGMKKICCICGWKHRQECDTITKNWWVSIAWKLHK